MADNLNSPQPQTCESAQTAEMVNPYELAKRREKAKAIADHLHGLRITAENCQVLLNDSYYWDKAAMECKPQQTFPGLTTRRMVIDFLAAMEAAHVS